MGAAEARAGPRPGGWAPVAFFVTGG